MNNERDRFIVYHQPEAHKSERVRLLFAQNENILRAAEKAVETAAQKMGVRFEAPSENTKLKQCVEA